MYELFPGNYAWSQAALRGMFAGGEPGEVLRAVEDLAGSPAVDAEAWFRAWSRIQAVATGRAERALASGHRLTAATGFRCAALYAQWAPAFLATADPRRADGTRRSVELFGRYAGLAELPIERCEVPLEAASFPAWLVRPAAPGPAPAMVFLPGWDSTKEQGIGLALALAARGIATLLCDGPGNGEALAFGGLVGRYDYEVPGSAALELLGSMPGRIDPARIGVVGISLGGYRAARFAAFEPRLAAAVIWGAIWDFGAVWRRQLGVPGSALPTSIEHGLHVTGSTTVDEVTAKLDRETLEDGVAERIRCPLLILHGERDTQIPAADAQRLHDRAGAPDRTLRIFSYDEGGSAHCQNDNRELAHEVIGDWLSDRLVRR